ncbi:MAG: GGDEF domain-containing protein [Proteobacteria bacterium]|nr:GGDEF domain-containing protein [Pseudomonadota bacterium]
MALPSFVTSDITRIAAAVVFSTLLFVSDQISTVDTNEAQLYPLALICLYRLRRRYVLQIVCGLCVFYTIAGYVLDPPADIWDGVTNRTFSIIVLLGAMVCLSKLSEYERALLMQSMTDPLTGLLNRRSFMDLSGKEETRARRHGNPFSVLMLDIDHFKKINDTFGHPVGDLAIKALADICSNALRPHDLLARYGGEEFVLTLPHTPTEGARVVAERIREAVEKVEVPSDKGVVRFTVSIGVSTYASGEAFDHIVERADKALYVSKQGGRNRVTVDGPAPLAAPA